MVTTGLIDGRLAEPTLAAHFPAGSGLTRGHGTGERFAEIKIASDTFAVNTIEAKHRLGVIGISRGFELPVLVDSFGAKVGQLHGQRFQFAKLLREADGLIGAL